MADEENQFDFCKNVDIHFLDYHTSVQNPVAISCEHGFSSVLVELGRLKELVSYIDKNSDKSISATCLIDFPYGSSSHDLRAYAVHSAKEKGAKHIEIIAPYGLIVKKDFHAVHTDIENIVKACDKLQMGLTYVIDQNSSFINESSRIKMCKIVSNLRLPCLSLSAGFYDDEISHKDNILNLRKFKDKIGPETKLKIYTDLLDENDFSMYIKAGCDKIGLPLPIAPKIVQAYNELIHKEAI